MDSFLRTYGLILYFLLLSLGALMTGVLIFSDKTDPPLPVEMQADSVNHYSPDITLL